jgi:hypothetical protein
MERPLIWHGLVILVLAVFIALVEGTAEAEPSELHLLRSAMVLGVAPDGTPFEVKSFYEDDEEVRFYTKVSAATAREPGRNYRLLYKWYTGDVVSLTTGVQKQVDLSPAYWLNSLHVAKLGSGRHRVELYIEGQLFASDDFDIRPLSRPYEPEEETTLKDSAVALLLAGDTQHFDALAMRYRASEERTTSGTWKLSMLYNAIDQHSYGPLDPHWKSLEDLADAWLAKEPNSPTAVVLNARIFRSHAWSWRGENARRNVPPANLQHYQQLLERARAVLDEHPLAAQQDPQWDTIRISIAREQGADSKEILERADRALTRWPCFYALHNSVINILRPNWGGSRQDIQAYVKLALDHSRSREGTQAYARIYYYIARSTLGDDPLDDLNALGAKWLPFKQSLAEILQKYPSTFNRDIARYMAGMGDDVPAYRALGRADTGGFFPIAWWDSHEWRQVFDAWAFEGKHADVPLGRRIWAYWSFLSGEGGPEFWEPVGLVAILAILFIEGGFWFLASRSRHSLPQWNLEQNAIHVFNPCNYPRVYLLVPVLGKNSLRLGVCLSVFGAASAYLLTTVPWGNPRETSIVLVGLIVAAALGLLVAVNVITVRAILRGDDLELRRLFGSKVVRRGDIFGVQYYATTSGLRIVSVVSRIPGALPLRVQRPVRIDDAFRIWFESLPLLADDWDEENSTQDDEGEQLTPGGRRLHD